MADYRRELRFAREMAVAAGQILRRGMSRRRPPRYKGRVDLVTAYDLKSEAFLVGQITKKFPGHSILAEEGSGCVQPSPCRWIIDPLDGTTNFAHGYPAFCVSIGLEVEGCLEVGVVYDPVHDELFYARRGGGAFVNRRRLAVSGEGRLERSLLATGFPYDIAESRVDNLDNFARMHKVARGIRRGGSAALDLCYLAAGRFDGFWELKLHPWDTAAGVVIVAEAGGRLTGFQGRPYSINDNNLLASNGRIHKQMQSILRKGRW